MNNPTLKHLQSLLTKDRNVIANGLFGAYASEDGPTAWSPIELLVITNAPTAWRTFLEPGFFERIGRIFHADVRHAEHFMTLSLTFEDFQRVVLVVVPQDRLRTVLQSRLAMWGQPAMVESTSETVLRLLKDTPAAPELPPLAEQLARVQTLFHEVQTKAIGAIVAVMNNDRLLGLQLALDLLHDMMTMRQIWQTYHTVAVTTAAAPTHHYSGNDFADTMPALSSEPRQLLHLIEWGLWEFSSAARSLFPEWDERNHTLIVALNRARAALPPDSAPPTVSD